MQPLVAITRSNQIESVHYGEFCVVDSTKKIHLHSGNPEMKVYIRSSAKPLQAAVMVHSGAMERYGLSSKELAVMCSSHSGQPFHLAAVNSILNKIGLSPDVLHCGSMYPYNPSVKQSLIQSNTRPTQLHNCCSGNHAGILALCLQCGYPVEDYTSPRHPVQQRILQAIGELLLCDPAEIILGTDGCSIPTYMLSLSQAASLYALLAAGNASDAAVGFGPALEQVRLAMAAHPEMVNGDHEFCTELIRETHGNVVGKIGAEGIYCAAIPAMQLGICLKIADGSERAVYPAMIQLLRQLGAIRDDEAQRLRHWVSPPVKNHRGSIVGSMTPVFDTDDL